jgi:hypothetical protein
VVRRDASLAAIDRPVHRRAVPASRTSNPSRERDTALIPCRAPATLVGGETPDDDLSSHSCDSSGLRCAGLGIA